MTLGGVIGRWSVRDDPATRAALWLRSRLGHWPHVSKNATMGTRAYTLEGGTT